MQVLFTAHETLSANVTDTSSSLRQRRVLEAVSSFACVAPPDLLQSFCARLHQKLREALAAAAADAKRESVAASV